MKTKVTYILSEIDKAIAFEWIAEYLDKSQFDLSFILLNAHNSLLEEYLQEHSIPVYRVSYVGKKSIPAAFFKVRQLLKKLETQVVHCHLFGACIVGLSAARSLRIKKRIYTRHHSTLHHAYFPRAVFYDKLLNRLATDIVAISHNVKQILIEKEKVKDKKIHLIHHGFLLDDFLNVKEEDVKALKEKYNLENNFPVIGVIARQVHLKGIQYIIPAFEKLLTIYPNAKLLLANAQGDYKSELQKLLQKIPSDNYIEIPFEANISALYHLFDVYVHTPIDAQLEAFGQTYVEALAAGTPSIFTLSGVASEFIEHEKNALVVPFQNSEAIFEAMEKILKDEKLKNQLKINGFSSIQHKFNLEHFIQKLEKLYK